ncbi:CRISPR-associated endoribonuclease Cas6 [Cetobacterium ceti]|uniref:CRISPR-associated endoribonuclease Cas6 n=1 Tax=Cetobacterium ceti TaxID=180163 RepID=A0A1T4NQK8_9FUSO|nr:CRISPR-associated endoribonuclease Cas6 [Cetobacterium ceti]SJZ81482.1 CRISPR-associated endoribonuclease Cas6 [Cetobacterium ceti]
MFYSLLIKIKAQKSGKFKFFTGKKLHGAFLNIIREADRELAQELHDKDIPKEFTVSNIFGTNSRKFKLEEGQNYFFRVTFLNDRIYKIFSSEICKNILLSRGILIENIPLSIEEIIYKDNKYSGIMDKIELESKRYRLIFKTPTLFKSGDFFIRYPEINLLFKSLLTKYNLYGEKKIDESILQFLYEINYEKIDLKLKREYLNKFFIEGFVGELIIRIDSKNKDLVEKINTLLNFGFYCGIGTKSSIGFGQVLVENLEGAEK